MSNNELEFTGKGHHQGDTQWYELKALPKGLKKIDKQFVAASERSGSFHGLFGNYDMYQHKDGFVIDIKEECILNHSLKENMVGVSMDNAKVIPKKDHRHTVLKPGIYYTGIQTKIDPFEGTKKRVLD